MYTNTPIWDSFLNIFCRAISVIIYFHLFKVIDNKTKNIEVEIENKIVNKQDIIVIVIIFALANIQLFNYIYKKRLW